MKYIEVSVPDDFDTPESVKSNDAHKVITIGDMLYTKGFKFLSDNDPHMVNKIHTLKAQHISELQAAESKFASRTASNDDHMKNLMSINTSLQSQLERQSSEYINSVRSIRHESNEMTSRLYNEKDILQAKVTENNDGILGKIDSLLGNGNTIDNIEKGNFGEDYVTTTITHEFPDASVDDVSGETAHCDCVWRMDSGAFRCLVEVKNVAQSKNISIDKFVRDMNINISNGEATCGIFVSLKTDTIPNKGRFKLEYLQGCPIIYISGVWKTPIVLPFALRMMRCIVQNMKNDNVDTLHTHEYITKTYNTIIREQSIINDLRKGVDRINMLIQKSQKNLTESMVYIEETMTKNGISTVHESPCSSDTGDCDKESLIETLTEYYRNNNKWPTANSSGIPKHDYKLFTFKALLQEAKQKLC